MRERLLQHADLFRKLRQLLVLFTLFSLPLTALGATETVTRTITFNEVVSANSPYVQNSTLPVSITDVVGGSSTNASGIVKILDDLNVIDSYTGNAYGTVFTLNNDENTTASKYFTIEIPGTYPAVPSQVTLKVAYANSGTDENKIQVGDYGNGQQDANVPQSGELVTNFYHYYHPYRSHETSLTETTLTYTGNNQSGLGTNRDEAKPLYICVYLNKNATFTIKEATITYDREDYGITVAGTPVKSDNVSNILADGANNGKVTFTPAATVNDPNVLTLDGANIDFSTDDVIKSTISAPLNINLIGVNTISCNGHYAFNVSNNLIFQTSGTTFGQLTISNTSGVDPQNFYSCTGTVSYENSLAATSNGTNSVVISKLLYELYIDGTQVTSGNASDVLTGTANAGKVSYDVTSNILTLDGVNLTMPIQTDIDNLIIELKGENKINTNAAENAIKRYSSNETLNLTIRPASTDPLGSINFANSASSSTSLVDGFNLSLGGELFAYPSLNNSSTHNSYITSLLIGGQMVAKTGSVFSSHSKISFNNASNNNVLTLSGVTDELKYSKIISGLSNLTINFDGVNTIVREDTLNIITSTNSSSVLTFTKASDASSLTISNYSGEHSIIHGFNSINYGDGIYLAAPAPTTYINTPNIGLMSALDNTKPINSLLLSSDPTYPLWVAGVQSTSTSPNGTNWSYDNDNKKLTLNGGDNGNTITGQIISGLGDLTIHITGHNTLKAAGSETNLIKSTNNGVLSFETDATADNYLYFENSAGEKFGDNSINGFTSVAYEAGLGYYSQFSQIIETLFIEYDNNRYKLHSSNATNIVGDGKVSFSYDSTNGNVLTLNSANIEVVEWQTDEDLTIALNGTCSINNTGHTYAINYHGNLTIVKASGAASAELRTSTNGYTPIGTYGLTLGSGLYLKPISYSSTTITDNPEFVLFNGYAMTNGQTISQAAGSLVYTESGSEKTLTFTDFQDAFGDGNNQVNAIETGVAGLKVVLVGDNKITCNDPNTYAFKGIRTDASIKFVKGGDGCKLTMDGNATSNSFSFGEGKVTYDKLVYSDVNERIICEPTPPTMGYNDQEKVVMQKDYTDGDIYYTITHADGKTADVAKTKYTAEFAMAAPGTVEAWVEANGATTAKIKGKYFGYKDAPIILNPGETKTPVLIPAIEDGDNIGYAETGAYTSDDTDIATFASGVITAVASGNVNVITTLATTGASVTTVILNYNNQFNTRVKVGTDISGYFEGQNQYGTYYNATDNYTIPAGMEAYVITGVNGNQVVLKSLSVLPKLTPLLLYKGTATSFNSVTTDETDNTSGNKLMHAEGNLTTTGIEYVLYKDEFVKATGVVSAGKCYLDMTGVALTRGTYGIGDNTTAIDDTLIDNEETANDNWFDLQGRRILKPTKPGLYIVNGKKVVINNK